MEYSKTFKFGKVDYNGTGKKKNLVDLEMTLKVEGDKKIFSVSADVWNTIHTDILCGGQCVDDIYIDFASQLQNPSLYKKIMTLWKKWHLNDMHAGCVHQRKFEKEEYSKHKNAYCKKCQYKFGSAWKYQAIAKRDLIEICHLLDFDPREVSQIIK
jgi:hypothetical protein